MHAASINRAVVLLRTAPREARGCPVRGSLRPFPGRSAAI